MAKGERLAAEAARAAVRAERPPERLVVRAPLKRECLECAKSFVIGPGPGRHKTFCHANCHARYTARNAARGKVLVPYAMAWRIGRNRKLIKDNEIFRELIAILDAWAEEDRNEGRPAPCEYVERQLAAGYLYQDRRRRTPPVRA